ncbi:ubiquitin carboxyl-hydrolase [Vreelandella populi]|uniref:Ubiquitin carboxyl-hydrolase n=1 Tax=Vreelandella populi TaxID=2498858 RepID=A0A3S0WQ01_9GAMM|nr:ubiquitin carboxyl-hydrolase [Halomonas populi]RUR48806.1 ubiquitin carboxyl-hydrolase [Halomonas populi]
MARPTKYTKAMTAKLCARLANGESLRSICLSEEFPDKSTILLWVVDGEHAEFSDQYRRAREAAGYAHADRIIDTVDKVSTAELDPQSAKAMLDGLKWAAERMAPKAHSPKVLQEHTSPDGSMTPKPTTIQLVAPNEQSDA